MKNIQPPTTKRINVKDENFNQQIVDYLNDLSICLTDIVFELKKLNGLFYNEKP